VEADRFQNLEYAEPEFRTEALAVLGEYNKNNANPIQKLFEVQRNTAFTTHTYKHTTMGFIEDIRQMPEQFAYSRQFFDRYYRPERTSIIIAGDVKPDAAFAMVEKYWGSWKPGGAVPAVPTEPAPEGPAVRARALGERDGSLGGRRLPRTRRIPDAEQPGEGRPAGAGRAGVLRLLPLLRALPASGGEGAEGGGSGLQLPRIASTPACSTSSPA
jgi:hypothetical protein